MVFLPLTTYSSNFFLPFSPFYMPVSSLATYTSSLGAASQTPLQSLGEFLLVPQMSVCLTVLPLFPVSG